MTKTARTLRKQPLQRRATDTVKAIVEAAARILERGQSAKLDTNRIARAAGVSVGTLYQYFADKQSVIELLSRDSREQRVRALHEAMQAIEGLPFEQALRELVRVGLEPELTRPTLSQELDRREQQLALDGADNERMLERLLVGFLGRYFHGQPAALASAARETRLTAQLLAENAAKHGDRAVDATVYKITQTVMALLDASLERRACTSSS